MVPPLRVKKRQRPYATQACDDDEVLVRQTGPTIPGPVSAQISDSRRDHVPRYSEWYFKRPPDPHPADDAYALPFGIRPSIQNIVCTVNMGSKLNISEIPKKALNAEYNPQRFSACIMRIRKPKSTALIFQSGKVVITGTTSVKDSEEAAKLFARQLKQIGYDIKLQDFQIQNVVATCNAKFTIRLEALSATYDGVQYEPELFPGLVWRMKNPHICFLIFATGKLVSTGLKRQKKIVDCGFLHEKCHQFLQL